MRVEKIFKALRLALDTESNKHYTGYSCSKNARSYSCRVLECKNKTYAKRLCNAHYLRLRHGKSLIRPIRCVLHRKYKCSCGRPRGRTGGWYLCQRCYTARRRTIIKDVLVELFGKRCSACLRRYPSYVFDFHHRRGSKQGGIGNLLSNVSLRVLAEEASKCILMCANCHREETHGRS
jgi:hypothetical protein